LEDVESLFELQPGAPYTYNSSNEMLTREGVPYTYDADGNTLSKTNGSGTASYAWDFENRLTSVTLPGTGGMVSFQYDPFGRRIQKTNASGTTAYVYDGDNIIEELTGATGTLSERYTYGPGIDEPLVGQRQPLIFCYEADGLGSVTSLTTPTGSVAATYTYDSFGFMTASTGSATNWFRYAARQFDSDTALYYNRARYYDPTTGRFLSEDPIRFQAGTNFYAYVNNSPPNLTDSSGLCPPQHPCAPSGKAPNPVIYAEYGESAGWLDNDLNLLSFRRGGILDAQVLYGGSQDYANYVFGVYMAAAGYSLPQALGFANAYAGSPSFKANFPFIGTKYPKLKPSDFGTKYTKTPAINIANITAGFNDERNGTLCTPTK